MTQLEQACSDILVKNMEYSDQTVYFLYDTESPLAKLLSNSWISVLENIKTGQNLKESLYQWGKIWIREFKNPPQPLYRWGFVNPDNPHSKEQNRVVTSHNIEENIRVGLNHHEIYKPTHISSKEIDTSLLNFENNSAEWIIEVDPQIESIKNELITLPAGSIVILVQSTNFRLSTFRIRLELFHRGIHVVEFNHLAYISDQEIETFANCLTYNTPEYVRIQNAFTELEKTATFTRVQSVNGEFLTFWAVENIRGNTWDYSQSVNKWWTYPIWELFTEARDLSDVNGKCLIEAYPREDFSVEHCESFEIIIENGRVLPNDHFPPIFAKLYNWVVQYEWEVMVRELGFGLNNAISNTTPLSDINFHERKTGVHLSLGKKHGIYGKKLPKTEIQRFHIDVFVALEAVYVDDKRVFENGRWTV
jgi:aminopeptidase